MTTPLDPKRLLEDTLAADESFREASLETTLRAVRQRRQTRQHQRASLVAGGVLLAGAAAMFYASHRGPAVSPAPSVTVATSGGASILSTVPLRPETVVTTRLGGVDLVASEPLSVLRVTTGDTAVPALNIDDAGLFTLLAGRPAAIVRPKGARAELLLLDAVK